MNSHPLSYIFFSMVIESVEPIKNNASQLNLGLMYEIEQFENYNRKYDSFFFYFFMTVDANP
jgi:hypothetical protein